MSQSRNSARQAVALKYDEGQGAAPIIVASGLGHMAEKIVEAAADSGVPIYEDNSLATILTQLRLGQEIPPELYKAIVDIYVYFLHFDPDHPEQHPYDLVQPPVEEPEASEFLPMDLEEV